MKPPTPINLPLDLKVGRVTAVRAEDGRDGKRRRSGTGAPYPDGLGMKLTGLPWFHTWRGVYIFVFGSFVLWVAPALLP